MNILGKVIEARLRAKMQMAVVCDYCEQQYGLMPGVSITDAVIVLRVLVEKYIEDRRSCTRFVRARLSSL